MKMKFVSASAVLVGLFMFAGAPAAEAQMVTCEEFGQQLQADCTAGDLLGGFTDCLGFTNGGCGIDANEAVNTYCGGNTEACGGSCPATTDACDAGGAGGTACESGGGSACTVAPVSTLATDARGFLGLGFLMIPAVVLLGWRKRLIRKQAEGKKQA